MSKCRIFDRRRNCLINSDKKSAIEDFDKFLFDVNIELLTDISKVFVSNVR